MTVTLDGVPLAPQANTTNNAEQSINPGIRCIQSSAEAMGVVHHAHRNEVDEKLHYKLP